MKNNENFRKAQKLVNEIAEISSRLEVIDYNRSFKILPDFVQSYSRDRFDLTLDNRKGYGNGVGNKDGKKYQIKFTTLNKKKIFSSTLDNIRPGEFDFLIAVILDINYDIIKVFKIPYDIVCQKDYLNKDRFGIGKVIEKLEEYKISIE